MTCAGCASFPASLADLVGWQHFHSERPCWWFVRIVYQRHRGTRLAGGAGFTVDSSRAEIRHGREVWRRVSQATPYDLVVLQGPYLTHVGVAVDAASFLHVPTAAAGVCLGLLERYAEHLVGVYRRAA